ncbi:hypothetical protein ON010_g10781 [Phytophthora cinnamomi]|nr:hypothetical protein ON010_g10781 [Phytophthora cinnamomi]
MALGFEPPTSTGGNDTTSFQYIVIIYGPSYGFETSYNVTSNSLDACDLHHDTTYVVSVAISTGNGMGESQIVNVTTGALTAPSEVVGLLEVTTTSGCSTISWNAPLDKGGVSIEFYEIAVTNHASNGVQYVGVPGSELTATISFLVASTSYSFSVHAVNDGGLVGPESSVTVSTGNAVTPQQPPPPELVLATGGALFVTVVAPVDCGGSDLSSYILNIARHTGGEIEYRQYASGSIESVLYDRHVANVSIYGLLSKSEYFITVSLENAQGWSGPSEEKAYSTSGPTPVRGMAPPIVTFEDPGEITLEWTTPLDSGGLGIVGYTVQSRHQLADGSWSLSETVYDGRSSLEQTALITSIVQSTQYAFSVTAYNFRMLCRPDEYVTPSDELVIKSQDASMPSLPKNFRYVQVTGGSITLVWDPPRSAGAQPLLSYLVNGSVEGSQLVPMANISVTAATSVTLYAFTALTVYDFAVAGENALGVGPYTSFLRVSTTAVSAPSQPKNLTQILVSSGGTIELSWDPPDDSGGVQVQQYTILRDENEVGVVTTTTFVDQNDVEADTSYNYVVFASNDIVSGAESALLVAHSSVASVASPPLATAKAGGGYAVLTISPSADSGGSPILYFMITVLRGAVFVDVYNCSDTIFTVPALYADAQYSVRVQTVNAAGNSDTTTLNLSTTSATVPDKMLAPSLVSRTGGAIRLGILPPANFGGAEIRGYNIFVNDNLGDVVKISTTEYDVVGLTALTAYSVAISAKNIIGESDLSDPIAISTTEVTAPGIVWNLDCAFVSYNTIEVAWTMPQDFGGDESTVSYEAELNSGAANSSITSCNTNSATFSDLLPAITYTIQVRALNGAGTGPWSTGLDVITDPVSPGIISFATNETSVSEAGGSVKLTLLRTMGGYMPAKCSFTTVDGTAVADVQYEGSNGEVDFARNVSSQCIVISIINNAIADDPDKYFFVSIQAYDDESGEIGNISTIKIIILDDGDAGVLAFDQSNYTVSESVSTLSVKIVRTRAFSGSGDIAIDTLDHPGGAVAGVDYNVQNNVVSFSDQQVEATVSIEITNDAIYQPKKTFQLQLRAITGRISVGDPPANALVSILDDGDISPPGLPTSVQVVIVSGGAVNVSWLAPDYLGAELVTAMSYNVSVLAVQSKITRELSVTSCSAAILQLAARAAYRISVAAVNDELMGDYTAPVSVTMGAPTPPSNPLNVQVLSRTGGMATLSWTVPVDYGGADIGSYRVNVTRSSDNLYIGSYTTDDVIASTNNLDPLTSYSATIEAINNDGLAGNASTPVLFTTVAASMPGKPANLVITKTTGGALYMLMEDPMDVGGSPILNYTLLMTSAQYPTIFRQVYQGSSPSFTATHLTFSTVYMLQYEVASAVGSSEFSDVFTAATSYLSIPDEAQNIVAVSRTGGSVTLSWTPPFDFGGADITVYDVSFFLGPPVRSQFRQRVSGVDPNAASVTAKVVGLLANSYYGFSVAGVNDASVCEDPSAILQRTIVYSSTDPFVTLPDTPRGLTVAQSTSGMQVIQWSPSEDAGGSFFITYLLYSNDGSILYNGTNPTFARGSLNRSTRYGYAVAAWNTAGTSIQSTLVFATTNAAIVAPSQPLQLTQTTSTGGSIGLTWQMPLDSGGDKLTGYKLFRNSVWLADVAATGPILSFLDDRDLIADQQYIYVVHATNSIGLGAMSDKLTASTDPATAPSSPDSLTVTSSGGNLTAIWVPAANTGGIPLGFFSLQVLVNSVVAFETNITNTSVLAYSVFGVRAGTTYTIQLTSGNQIGESLPIVQTVTNGAALYPNPPPAPEQFANSTSLAPWMIRLKLYLPIDDGGAPISQLLVYRNDTKYTATSVDDADQAVLGDPTTRFTLIDVGPLHADSVYYFAVSAVSPVGEGARSSVLLVKTNAATLPSVPINFAVGLRTSFSVFLQWGAPIDTGGDEVDYEISYTNTNTSEILGATVNDTTVEIPKLVPGDVYLFQLRSKNSAGPSNWTPGLLTQTDVTQRGFITYAVASPTVYENVSSVTIDLLRVNGSAGTVTCSYTDGSGTAIPGQDYLLPTESARSFSFSGELTKQSFNVTIINDDVYEPNPRTINLILTDTTLGRTDLIPPTTITITILDDGDAGTIGFTTSAISVLENARVLSLSLQRLNGKSTATSVRVVP